MRLVSLELSGFRGFPKREAFDLDADAIIVVGANGHGKTSLFDGIFWALSGRIPRLHNNEARLLSMYSETGQARVELVLRDPSTGNRFTVTRSHDGQEGKVIFATPDQVYQGPSAEGKLIELLWPDAASAIDSREAIASVLACCVYLQQDLIRQFVEASSDQERFDAVSELVGAGRVTELQDSLERAKKAWSTVTNQRQDELLPIRQRLSTIEARLSELTNRAARASPPISPNDWSLWLQNLASVGLKPIQIEPESREAPSVIDNAIKQLDSLRRSTERRSQALRTIQTEISSLAARPMPEIPALRDNLIALQKQLEEQRRIVGQEQERRSVLRRIQVELKEKNEQLKTLAALALKHLDERCPVCAQTYDKEATRLRLEVMAKAGIGETQPPPQLDKLPEVLDALDAKERKVAAAELALRTGELSLNERKVAQQSLSKRLSELGVAATDDIERSVAVDKATTEAEILIRRIADLQSVGESLALRLTESSTISTIDELRREAEALRRDIADRENTLISRNLTGDSAQRIIEALREAGSEVVGVRLREIGPLLQSIYSRIDPHPAFRLVSFLTRVVRGKGQLSTLVSDPIENKECDAPAAVLSSSQVNALAVSVFLALNMGIPNPPLSLAMLDDPLQSLDDVNLLGLVDLLRRAKDRRQLCVSTHDVRFGDLLARKLRPSSDKGRTIVIDLGGWSRRGPTVGMHEVKSDPSPLRLVASRR